MNQTLYYRVTLESQQSVDLLDFLDLTLLQCSIESRLLNRESRYRNARLYKAH